MLISYNWLQKYFDEKLPEAEKIADGIIFHSFEIENVEKIKDDIVFDIKILPDRAHDCLSHFGIAKEISAIFDIPLKKEIFQEEENLSKSELNIEIKNDNCRRYIGQVIKGVKIGPSPAWLKEKLEIIGQRSINNIVDATNYIMFDIGNPIHAFDLNKLKNSKIIVDNAKNGEKITLLDGKVVVLDESVLTIRDEDDPLAIAGIKGGKKAEIDENTQNIVIEVANFEPISTRKSAKKLGIFTDSAKRFENEIPAKLAKIAIRKITDLILEVASGEKFEAIDVYKESEKEENKYVSFDILYINKLLGLDLKKEGVDKILERLNYSYEYKDEEYKITVPFLRIDIKNKEDMAEEIGRIYGYDKIVLELPKNSFEIKNDEVWQKINLAKYKLINDGYKEIMTYIFTNKGEVEVLASASDKKFLRTNLADGMRESLKLNKINLPLLDILELKVFEIGTVFKKDKEVMNVAYGDEKNITEVSLDEFINNSNFLQEKALPQESPRQGLEEQNIFKPWSVYPFITRDIAVWVPEEVRSEELAQIYKEFGTELLVREPRLFDQFTKEGRTSYAFRLVFQSYEKTLTDDEINLIMSNIEEKITSKGWVVR